jgi:ABC-type phosphate transport system substrate-binding protein
VWLSNYFTQRDAVKKILFFWILGIGIATGPILTASAEEIVFIVNSKNPIQKISVSEIQELYLKKKRSWPEGTNVRFLDRSNSLEIKKLFLSKFLKKSSDEVDLYWIGQKLYSGNSAPLQEISDPMTVKFVGSIVGAISYVSQSYSINSKNVKTLKVE